MYMSKYTGVFLPSFLKNVLNALFPKLLYKKRAKKESEKNTDIQYSRRTESVLLIFACVIEGFFT